MAYDAPHPVNFDFNALGYTPPYPVNFDFDPLLTAAVLTGAFSTQANFTQPGYIITPRPVIRYVAATFNSRRTDTLPLTVKTCLPKPAAHPKAAAVNTARALATAAGFKLCAPSKSLSPTPSGRCSWQQQAQGLRDTRLVKRDLLAANKQKLCALTDHASPLQASAVAGFDLLYFAKTRWCAKIEDTAAARREEQAHYYPDPTVTPYGLGNDFYINPSSSLVGGAATVVAEMEYVPPYPVNFDFTGANYTPPYPVNFNLGASGLSPVNRSYLVYTNNPDPYEASTVFELPYTTVSQTVQVISEAGLVRTRVCNNWQPATRTDVRKCSHVQKASQALSGTSVPRDPPRPPPVDPPAHITVTIPTREVYKMHHTLSVTTLNLTPVNMVNVNLSLDADSFAWQFTGVLADKTQLPLVQQTGNQPPVQLIVTINGVAWKVVVERIEHRREFTQRTINISGRGLTALLGQPYEQPASATQSSDLTVQQIADLLMPNGWLLNWSAYMPIPWVVPSGAFSYTLQTPIQALAQIAQNIGAMLVPSRDSQNITIMPRYPVRPWEFTALSPDLIIPESAVRAVTYRTVIPTQANGVYVHGGEIGGVLGWCRLTGTDGARLAPTVSNALMTDVAGCRLLGERILAGQHAQPKIQSVTLPFDNVDFPLATIGQFVQITADNVPVRGVVNSVTLEAGLGSVRQTLQIGEETANTWSLFKELLPRDPLLVGTVAVSDGATSLVTLLDNGVVRVRGTASVGQKVYIRFGKIEGNAPNLTQSEIVV